MTLFKKVFDSHFSEDSREVERILSGSPEAADDDHADLPVQEQASPVLLEEAPLEPSIAPEPSFAEAPVEIEKPHEVSIAERAALAHAQMNAMRPTAVTDDVAVLRPDVPEPSSVSPESTKDPKDFVRPVEAGVPEAIPANGSRGRVKTRLLGFHQATEMKADPFQKEQTEAAAPPHMYPTGWLVVVEGPGEGNALPIFDGVSSIGRGEDQALCLDFGDTSISRQNHAAIAYDGEQNAFFLGHGGKSNIIRLNDRPVLSTEELAHADILRIGETTLRFVALCGADFKWNERQHAE